MKKYISNSLIENNYYKNMIINHEHEIKLLKETLYKFEQKERTIKGIKIKLLINVLKNKTGITAFPFNEIFLFTS